MKDHEVQVGALVICVLSGSDYYGEVGIITYVARFGNKLQFYSIKNNNGQDIGSFWGRWTSPNHWDILAPKQINKGYSKAVSKECPCGITRIDCDYHK